MRFLLEEISLKIETLCKLGDSLAGTRRFPEACKAYEAAWELLPEPRTEWEAAAWILSAIGDALFLNGEFSASQDFLLKAMHCPDSIGNPFLHLRLGQCRFEMGELDRSSDELMRAYMGAGKEIFEDEDPKYFRFLQSRARSL